MEVTSASANAVCVLTVCAVTAVREVPREGLSVICCTRKLMALKFQKINKATRGHLEAVKLKIGSAYFVAISWK